MSVSHPGSDQQRLLPSAIEHSLNDLGVRFAGGALVALASSSWLALLSWQTRDGLASASGKAARNLLGSFGAGLSDMLVHTTGIAVVFVLICPMVWGLELLASVRWIASFRLKLLAAFGGALALAGAASSLPFVPGWPLPGGAGGMLGDLVYNLATSTLFRFGFERYSIVTVLLLAGAGGWLTLKALGIAVSELGWPLHRLTSLAEARIEPQPAPTAPAAGPTPAPMAAPAPAEPPAPRSTGPVLHMPPPPPAPPSAPPLSITTPDAFDPYDADETTVDDTARAFAERFAPSPPETPRKRGGQRIVPMLQTTLAKSRERAAGYRKPGLNLLRRGNSGRSAPTTDIHDGSQALLEVLSAFGVKGEIRQARPGPVVTRYELEPVRGTKISRIIGLADDFARELGALAVRVSTTPGRTTIGIEVPNETRETVALRDILESEAFAGQPMQLPIALGKGIAGEPVAMDLARMPHLLVAGTTGSGKSVGLNAMILSLLYHMEPSEARLLLIDPKMLELSQYDRIPHLLHPVITDPDEAAQALEWAVAEMEDRYRRMAQLGTRNIELFNAKVRNAKATGGRLTRTVQTGFDNATGRAIYERIELDDNPMPYIVIVIDELADLMVTSGKKVEGSIQRLAQKARAAGIHLVMATQRPSVDVITGTIKANFPVRISFRVASRIDSRTIINEPGAEQLLGHGDMLLTSGSGQHLRVHGAYVSDEEIERVTDALREEGEPDYIDLSKHKVAEVARGRSKVSRVADARAAAEAKAHEETYAAALAIVAGDRKVSSGHLHRRLGLPETLAAELIERMEREGHVSPPNLLGRRTILIERMDDAISVPRFRA